MEYSSSAFVSYTESSYMLFPYSDVSLDITVKLNFKLNNNPSLPLAIFFKFTLNMKTIPHIPLRPTELSCPRRAQSSPSTMLSTYKYNLSVRDALHPSLQKYACLLAMAKKQNFEVRCDHGHYSVYFFRTDNIQQFSH